MAFALSILYLVTYYLTPVRLFGPLAAFHLELILAVLVFFVSLPTFQRSFILKTPQSLALIGLAFASFLSVVFGERWLGGGVRAVLDYLPNAFAYFLICLHCTSKKKLQVLILMLQFVCLFAIVNGFFDLHHGIPESGPIVSQTTGRIDLVQWKADHPFLLPQKNDAGTWFYRLRGEGDINDPNDFGQLLALAVPLIFIFWRPQRTVRNFVFVLLPVAALLFGIFLTHSRGALLSLMAMVVVAARRRIGTAPAMFVAVALFVAAMAMHFTGGREISADSGSDRTSLWGQGLEILRAHPLFGVGFGQMREYTDVHLTAHNSVVVCAAELGLFGFYFWCLFLFPTMRSALAVASPVAVSEGVPIAQEIGRFPAMTRKVEAIDKAEINRLGRLLVLSLTGFLVAAWFLSRAYVLSFFLLGGITEVVFEMALQRGMIAPRMRFARVALYAGGLAISLMVMMYLMLRILNLMH
ncbi:MAG: O-antigen ligase family protein [Terracidiphilus sp.]|jgi:hypothetical protein